MATQGYGFFSGPTDQRMRPTTLTFARNLYLRDLMVANGDAAKPIWISEAAWNPVDDPAVPDIPNKEQFGSVTLDQAARYMPLAYQRAQQEWSWVGVIDYWFFKRADDHEIDQPLLLFPHGRAGFHAAADLRRDEDLHRQTTPPTLYRGVHQAEDWAIQTDDDALLVSQQDAQFDEALQTSHATFTFQRHRLDRALDGCVRAQPDHQHRRQHARKP